MTGQVLGAQILAVVDGVTLAINLSLIIGGVLLAGFALVVCVIGYTAFRAWWFTRKQARSMAAYEEDLEVEKAEWKRLQSESFFRNPRQRPG